MQFYKQWLTFSAYFLYHIYDSLTQTVVNITVNKIDI